MNNSKCLDSELTFLGTGAADWDKGSSLGEFRGSASVLVDGHILIDCTLNTLKKMKELGIGWSAISDILITHSHEDHFDPKAIQELVLARKHLTDYPLTVYIEESWASKVALSNLVKPLEVGKVIQIGEYKILPLASNHMGLYDQEIPFHYLFSNKDVCWLYGTDGSWILSETWNIIKEYQLDCWVVDCTIGDGYDGDYRIFEHNSLPMIRLMAKTFLQQGVLKKEAPIILTHLAKYLHPEQEKLESTLSMPFLSAYDGYKYKVSNK